MSRKPRTKSRKKSAKVRRTVVVPLAPPFVQISVAGGDRSDAVYGLDAHGRVWASLVCFKDGDIGARLWERLPRDSAEN